MLKLSVWILLMAALAWSCVNSSKKEEPWSERMARSEMQRFPEPWMIEKAKTPRWGYTHGLVVCSMLELWKHTGNSVYFDYAKIYADSLIDEAGRVKMNYLSFNIDNINAGKSLFDLYEKTGNERYKTAMDTLRKQLREQPRTSEGGYWHKLKYDHQMWLDGIFMASPFLAQYGQVFHEPEAQLEAIRQIKLMAKYSYDPETGLYYHGWDESRAQKWANPKTGCSPNFWSRSLGWYGAALVDVLDFIPEDISGRDSVLQIVDNLAASLAKYQDKESGTWYQVTTEGHREGNYLESSATALFVYFYAKAVNKGYIDAAYASVAHRGFDGMIKAFIRPKEDTTYTITNCCAVAGLGGDKRYRDGSFEYYISEPVIDNDPKSVGAFIFAAIECERLKQ